MFMSFAYVQIKKGKVMRNLKPTSINGLTIKPLKERGNYKFIGIDERIINRIRKIRNSQLPEFDKEITHDTFAVPTLAFTIGRY